MVTQTGDGDLAYQRSACVNLAFSKLGHPEYWTGSNAWCYWAFAVPEGVAAICRSSNATNALPDEKHPILHPLDLVDMLGITEIPADFPPEVVSESAFEQGGKSMEMVRFRVTRNRTEILLTLDTSEALVRQINVMDRATGAMLALARLGTYRPLATNVSANVPSPLVPTGVVLESLAIDARVELNAQYWGEAPAGRATISSRVFDFESLVQTFKPQRILVLDSDRTDPALTSEEVARLLGTGGPPPNSAPRK